MLRMYPNGILGENLHVRNFNFFGTDDEKLFEDNLKTKPIDWYYRTNKITYNFNTNGHRCDEINQLDFDNYILFAGDSHTVGIGVEFEKSYPYLVAKNLGVSYYNLAIGGTGLDTLVYNIIKWISTYPKPKYISLAHTDIRRFITIDKLSDLLCKVGVSWADEVQQKFIVNGDICDYWKTRFKLNYQMITSLLDHKDIKYSNISLVRSSTDPLVINPVGNNIDFGRDMHLGNDSHRITANYIIDDYNKQYKVDKYLNANTYPITRRESN